MRSGATLVGWMYLGELDAAWDIVEDLGSDYDAYSNVSSVGWRRLTDERKRTAPRQLQCRGAVRCAC